MNTILEMMEKRNEAWEGAKAFVESKRDKDGLLSEEDANTYAGMAGNIKGITIELNGDTTKLDKALREVGKETRTVQRQLSEVEKALKLDPGNTDLIKQKQRLLGEEIQSTKDKLGMLRQADQDVSKDMELITVGMAFRDSGGIRHKKRYRGYCCDRSRFTYQMDESAFQRTAGQQ